MTIQFTAGAPQDTHTKLGNWLPDIQQVSMAGGATEEETINISDAYEVKYLSVEAIASGELLNAVHTSRWRHLVMSTAQAHAHAEIELDENHQPVALHTGQGKNGLQSVLNTVDSLEIDYEVCVLKSPALRFIALHLHNDNEDWILPYPPNATSLTNYQRLTAADTLAVLQPMAQEIIEAMAVGEGIGG